MWKLEESGMSVITGSETAVDHVLRIPVHGARKVEMRLAPLADRDRFDPLQWRHVGLTPVSGDHLFFQVDLNTLSLPDGSYEYEFILDDRGDAPVPDPYAVEIVRFGGYRGVFHIVNGKRTVRPFAWEDELPEGVTLPQNNALVIYELPLRWVGAASPDYARQIGLGDFDHLIFEHLDQLAELGINAIELLPIQDSPDTLNWGYGTRFFFSPDIDLGSAVDTKFFVKQCHQRGIRIILDLVMNHARKCPLELLADDRYFLKDGSEEGGRPDWGGRIFRYRRPASDGSFPAREFHYRMAAFWINEYHIDGFRIDEFKGIDHWEFIQTFRDRAWEAYRSRFPDRPFLVVAEDSWCRIETTQDRPESPNGRKVVDSIWNFSFRDECRRILRNQIHTEWHQPSRSERIRAALSGERLWDDWDRRFRSGITDMIQAVNYTTSHDVEEEDEQRFMNDIFGDLLRLRWLGSGSVDNVRALLNDLSSAPPAVREAHEEALDRVGSGFALIMTAVGIPMFLAGEEFADVHDLEHQDWRLKMSDPIDWRRAAKPGHHALRERIKELIKLRTTAPALQRNEIEFFYYHPSMDDDHGIRVFAYCRTGGRTLGSHEQVVVLANGGPHHFPQFKVPWPWTEPGRIQEHGVPPTGDLPHFRPDRREATFSLAPFQVRVFST
ncbi:alpha-amylase family glycosyl hydrolase [Thiohalomonas denitrificans]|uniref:alpha-amylase family glycosyl hydrolase n=1 Tax=Thiohalomonas denitrificans TaxID=415747 RepID=UPI0026F161E6|nr:alpha-amylase family glycosyl hydrolase [Thiohalomonas denitrificans]